MTTVDEAYLPWRNVRGFGPGAPRPTVVVVDDQPANVTLLERLLAGADIGADVIGFTNPFEGLEHCRQQPPSLVLLDLHMPGMDGIEFMQHLQLVAPEGSLLPVLVLTADVTPEARTRALMAGARDFVTKPFERTEVLLRVANLLEIRAFYDRLTERNTRLQAELGVRLAAEQAAQDDLARRHANVDAALRPDGLSMVFQPVAKIATGAIVGVEALARFAAEPARTPDVWFAEADSIGRGPELELAAVTKAISRMDELPDDAFLAVNVSPQTAMSEVLPMMLECRPMDRIVLELTEHTRVDDYDALLSALRRMRSNGLRIAVDDTGAGYAGFQALLRLRPDILKLDLTLTRDIDTDPIRRSLAAALVAFADQIGAELIAEGVETDGELRTLRRIGIPWGQGFRLARPGPLPLPHRRLSGLPDV